MKHVDVAIIGGSLAGAACVRELTRLGIDAVAFERDRFPRDKVCGGFLSPGAVDLLDELEMLDAVRAAGARTVCSSTIRMRGREVNVELPGRGLGISRRALDELMADHERVQRGVVREVRRTESGFRVELEGSEVSAAVVVDAAGKGSRFTPRKVVPQFGVQFYESAPRGDVLDFWFFEEGYGGAVSVEGGRSNACFLISKDALRHLPSWTGGEGRRPEWLVKRFLEQPPRLRETRRLRDLYSIAQPAPPVQEGRCSFDTSNMLITGPLAYDRLPSDFLAIGDAAGMIDPFCGEGMRHALDTALTAARTIATGLHRGDNYAAIRARYETESAKRWRGKRRMGAWIRHMLQHPAVTSIGFRFRPEFWFRQLWS